MRVLHLGKFFPPAPGGIEVFLADLTGAQASQHEVACLVHQDRQHAPQPPPELTLFTSRSLGQLLYTPLAPGWPLALHRAIRRFKPDVLHLHLPNPVTTAALMLPSARALPWVIHWHADVETVDSRSAIRLAYRLYRRFEQAMLRRARAIIATSPDYAKASVALRSHLDRVHTVPLGIAQQRLGTTSSDDPNAWPGGGLKLLALGRLSHYKGFIHLLEAIAGQEDVSLAIIGEGEEKNRLASAITRLGLQSRVRLMGHLPQAQVNRAIAECDVVCLPSLARAEAFGMTLLEAMVFGKPVIASDLTGSGMPWVVRQAEHGLLAKPGDVDALRQCIDQLRDRALRHRLGQNGVSALQAEFRIEQVAERLTGIYDEVGGRQ